MCILNVRILSEETRSKKRLRNQHIINKIRVYCKKCIERIKVSELMTLDVLSVKYLIKQNKKRATVDINCYHMCTYFNKIFFFFLMLVKILSRISLDLFLLTFKNVITLILTSICV